MRDESRNDDGTRYTALIVSPEMIFDCPMNFFIKTVSIELLPANNGTWDARAVISNYLDYVRLWERSLLKRLIIRAAYIYPVIFLK